MKPQSGTPPYQSSVRRLVKPVRVPSVFIRLDVLRRYGRLFVGKAVARLLSPEERLEEDGPCPGQTENGQASVAYPVPLLPSLRRVSALFLDFDGVMTDNRVLVDENGREYVWCHRGDGWGIARLKEAGIKVFVISGETNPVVAARCRKLGVPFVQGAGDKLPALKGLCQHHSLTRDGTRDGIAYVGNDVNDLECLGWVGLPIAVADAHPLVIRASRLTLSNKGGYGAVREVCDLILQSRGNAANEL